MMYRVYLSICSHILKRARWSGFQMPCRSPKAASVQNDWNLSLPLDFRKAGVTSPLARHCKFKFWLRNNYWTEAATLGHRPRTDFWSRLGKITGRTKLQFETNCPSHSAGTEPHCCLCWGSESHLQRPGPPSGFLPPTMSYVTYNVVCWSLQCRMLDTQCRTSLSDSAYDIISVIHW
jgi:hypothetical protein